MAKIRKPKQIEGSGCFPGHTQIWMADDSFKPISEIKVGDRVHCFDWDHNIFVRSVTEVSDHVEDVYQYHFWGGTFEATPNHGFYTIEKKFRAIGEFLPDDLLYDSEWAFYPFLGSKYIGRKKVYNFRVEEFKSYFVTPFKLAVSNGGKGKKGQGNKPVEEADTGFSTAKATVVEVLSEGRIEGLLNGAKSIYLDQTPVVGSDNKRNFKGFRYRARNGTATQSVIPEWSDRVESENSVNVEVKKATPITRTITNPNLDAIRVRLGVRLVKYESDGDIVGSSITFRIFIKQGSGPFVKRLDKTIKGKYSSLVEFEYQFNVKNLGGTVNTFSVRVEKVTDDSTSQKLVSQLQFQSFAEIIQAKLTYKHTAVIGMEFDAEQFNSIPVRAYRVGGLRVRIPSNATINSDRALTFSGAWDGTFQTPTVACNDPVWQLYEILTNTRWGLGKYLDPNTIDKWSLYQASVYNNQYVPDGQGGMEPRYQCSTVLQTKEKVFDIINAFCSSCNLKPYWAEGTMFFWQDRPTPVTMQFTQADVENGDFVYSSTAIRSRYTVAIVTWNNPEKFYEQDQEPVEDAEGIAKYGVRELEVVAYGCCSRTLARRMGRWALFSSRFETETVSFTARAYAAFCRPGDVIQIADDKRANIRYGGLVKRKISNSSVELDSFVNVTSGMSITLMDAFGVLHTRSITNPPGNTSTITFSPTLVNGINPESNYVITSALVNPQLFRVLSVTPNYSDPTKVEILGIKHFPDKYAAIENDLDVRNLPIRNRLPEVVNPPTNISVNFLTYQVAPVEIKTMIIRWEHPKVNGFIDPAIRGYVVEFRRLNEGEWNAPITVPLVNETRVENLAEGVYQVRVASIDANNKTSLWVESGLVPFNPLINESLNNSQTRPFILW